MQYVCSLKSTFLVVHGSVLGVVLMLLLSVDVLQKEIAVDPYTGTSAANSCSG